MIYQDDRQNHCEVRKHVPHSSGQTKKKKSVAQPRPRILVQPRGIGPITIPNENDVLSGRGGRINAHPGNVQFRQHVITKRETYLDSRTKKLEKAHIAALLVYNIRSLEPPGRFLKQDGDGSWWDIGDQKAIKKVGQAMREFSRVDPKDESMGEPRQQDRKPVCHDVSQQPTNHASTAPSKLHGFTTDVEAVGASFQPPLDHPLSSVVDALQILRSGNTPPSPEQITNRFIPSSQTCHAPEGQMTYSAVKDTGSRQNDQFSPEKHDGQAARHQKLAKESPNPNSSVIAVDTQSEANSKPSTMHSTVVEHIFNRTFSPARTSTLSTLDLPDQALKQVVSAVSLDAAAVEQSSSSQVSAPGCTSVHRAVGKEAAGAPPNIDTETTAVGVASGDTLLQQAISSTLQQQPQLKKTRVSEEIFGRLLYPTGLSAIGATETHCSLSLVKEGSCHSSSLSHEATTATTTQTQTSKRKLVSD